MLMTWLVELFFVGQLHSDCRDVIVIYQGFFCFVGFFFAEQDPANQACDLPGWWNCSHFDLKMTVFILTLECNDFSDWLQDKTQLTMLMTWLFFAWQLHSVFSNIVISLV